MRSLLAALFFCTSLVAQSPSFFITDPTGSNIQGPLGATYQFPDTPQFSSSSVVLRATNPTNLTMEVITIWVADPSTSNSQSNQFTVNGVFLDKVLSPSSANFEDFTVSFTPNSVGPITGNLQVAYEVQENGCVLGSTDPATQCSEVTATVSTLQGNATAPQLVATYSGPAGNGTLQPESSSPQLDFGNVSLSSTATYTITIANDSTGTLNTPAVSIQFPQFESDPFALNVSTLSSTIAPGASTSFSVTFAPGQTGLVQATLAIGSNTFPLQGVGIVVGALDELQISYVDQTGVRGLPQAATPIDFGQVTSGTSGAATLTFTVTNPATSFSAVTVPNITVTGTAFTLTGAPATPVAIAPGQSITFQITFSNSAAGTYTGTLAIGTRQFSLVGESVSSALPDLSFQLDQQTLTSQQQVHLTIQLASPSPVTAIGELTMQFAPSVAGVSDDAAVNFTATSGRNLQVTVNSGAQTATYNNQSAITFQTGTTAGTITFTVTFPDKAPLTKSFTIAPQQVQISTSTAVRQSPNLVVTLNGYDNTYSVGNLTFTFYDTSGKLIPPSPLTLNAASDFHQYFFGPSDVGGAFAMQATFPVLNGDVTQVGSVTVGVANSVGSTSTTLNFQ